MTQLRSLILAGATLGVGMALASCGGGEVQVTSAYQTPAPQVSSLGLAEIHVRDAGGGYASGGTLTILDKQSKVVYSDNRFPGYVSLRNLPGIVTVIADHPLGTARLEEARVQEGGKTTLDVVLEPARPVTVGLFPARIPAEGINAARTELQLEVRVVASSGAPFNLKGVVPSMAAPLLSLENCSVWLESATETPVCRNDRGGPASLVSYQYQPNAAPMLAPARLPWASLLMVEISDRGCSGDRRVFCNLGGKVLAKESLSGPVFSPTGNYALPVGLVSQSATKGWSPLYLPSATTPDLSAMWRKDPASALSWLLWPEDWWGVWYTGPEHLTLRPQSVQAMAETPAAAVSLIDGLATAYRLSRDSAPDAHQRAVIAMVGGGDTSGKTDAQVEATATALRAQQDAAAIKTILVSLRLDENSPERAKLADLASALDAPLIIEGYPRDWTNATYDGMHAAMTLATELLSGASLPTVKAVFRMRTDPARPFQSGQLLRGRLWIESGLCQPTCGRLPLDFSVRIP